MRPSVVLSSGLVAPFQVVPPYNSEGDCLIKPVTQTAFFLPQVVMARFPSG